MDDLKYDFGMIGIGTMGRNLVLNMSDHGYSVAAIDRSQDQVDLLMGEASGRKIMGTTDISIFINALKTPRAIIMLVPAGKIVDAVLNEYLPLLAEHDLMMDWGNSHFTDTDLRIKFLAKSGIYFMGVGISGGESGARFGPSIMPGGPKIVYERVAGLLDNLAAKIENEPCTAWLGPGSAGHYVKMVHNGIEYGIMQLIAESYHLLKTVIGLNNKELHHIFLQWNKGRLQSFLIEITANIFLQTDELAAGDLLDKILDSAHQKGTGGWTSADAMNLQVPIPVIDMAVAMRDMSAYKTQRMAAQKILHGPELAFHEDKDQMITWLEEALYFSIITTYAQGFSLLHFASSTYQYDFNLERIARIWRGGCIIRSALLEDFRLAFSQQPDLPNLLLNTHLCEKLNQAQDGLRQIIRSAVELGIPVPALMCSLAYFDSYRSEWLPANLIQAQRDYFGAHTYERTDREGTFHTNWTQI